ncbi:MAG: gamma-glutamyl-gamma-aminobutyrate hydrolase family protein [Acidobacteria bacterium]|nr:gamma-glutamyl-gamma-aminobutyrate hydrolase family protein [Acidobacteriota bacterium]
MAKRPRIGITTRLEIETRRFYLGRDYSDAVEAHGGVPVLINLIPKEGYINGVLDDLDGILLPGSDSDIDPHYFGEQPHANLGSVVTEKDETDLLVLAEVEKRGLPLFAICFGMQALNVSRGGSLIQDIESQVDGHIKHQQGVPRARNSHHIVVEEGSLLGQMSAGNGNVRVNSHHHQAVGRLGNDLKATARASDGIVECIEDTRDGRFVVGVQWHPELSWADDRLSGKLFETFLRACV